MDTLTFTGVLVIEDCCNCHMPFAVDRAFYDQRRVDHGEFFCPAGHGQHYTGLSDLEKARREAEGLRSRLRVTERSEQFYRNEAAAERRRAAAARGQRTRVMNLITKGICPVAGCRRNFVNVREHMATVHPDFHTHEDGAS